MRKHFVKRPLPATTLWARPNRNRNGRAGVVAVVSSLLGRSICLGFHECMTAMDAKLKLAPDNSARRLRNRGKPHLG